jgi:hypothetical protein
MPGKTRFMATWQARRGWMVRLSITRRGGWRAWAQTSGDFERSLAALAGKTVINPHIDAESRRGRDYVRITLAMTVRAADVAEALASAWRTFQQAAHDDPNGWEMASAAAEVRPAESKPPTSLGVG